MPRRSCKPGTDVEMPARTPPMRIRNGQMTISETSSRKNEIWKGCISSPRYLTLTLISVNKTAEASTTGRAQLFFSTFCGRDIIPQPASRPVVKMTLPFLAVGHFAQRLGRFFKRVAARNARLDLAVIEHLHQIIKVLLIGFGLARHKAPQNTPTT